MSQKNHSIPQPRFKLPFLGHSLYLRKNMYSSLHELSSKLGPICQLALGSNKIILVSSFELIKEVCDESRFEKHIGPFMRFLRSQLFKEGLAFFDTQDPIWGKSFRIVLPGFQQKIIQEEYFPSMLKTMEKLFNKWDNNSGSEINLSNEMGHTILDIIGLCGFSYHFNSISSGSHLIKALDEAVALLAKKAFTPKFLDKLQFQSNKEYQEKASLIFTCVDEILKARKQAKPTHTDLLHFMLNGVDKMTGEKLNDYSIKNQILSLIVASYESTLNALILSFCALLTYPAVLEKAYAEVDRVLGTDPGQPQRAQSFFKLTYIQQVINECLRYWSTLFLERSPLKDTMLGGYPVKKGECIWTLISAAHGNKRLWGDDADSFNPDRFAPELVSGRDPSAFLGFGIGQRSCIGRQFAMFEISVILGMFLQKYQIHKSPKFKIDIKKVFNIQIDKTLWVTLEKRKHEKSKNESFQISQGVVA